MIDVILPTLNASNFLEPCLKSFKKYTRGVDYRIIAVDGMSTDNTLEILRKYQNECNIIDIITQTKRGCGNAYNLGLERCTSDYVLLLTADVILCSDAVTELLKIIEKDKDLAIVSPILLYPNNRIQYAGIGFYENCEPYHVGRLEKVDGYKVIKEYPAASLTFALMRKKYIFKFDEEYIYNYEDIDMTLKVFLAKKKMIVVPNIRVYHYEGSTILSIPDFPQIRMRAAQRFHLMWDSVIQEERVHDPVFWREGRVYG